MASSRRASSRALTALTALSLGAVTTGSLALAPVAQANPAGTGVVLSEVYGGGGNTGATFTHDFVELTNPTAGPVSLGGFSVQYRSASGTAAPSGVVALDPVTLPAGGHYLLQLAGGTTGAALPAADQQDPTVNLSGTSGTVLLVEGTAAVDPGTGAVQGADGLVDLVGFGASNTYENAGSVTELRAPSPSNTASIARTPTDGADTDDNSADYALRAGTAMSPAACGNACVRELPVSGVQGTGSTSPVVGKRVTTRGVVTAAYPTGGLDHFVIQTPGTGATAGAASDAVAVAGAGAVAAMGSGVGIGDHVDVTGTVAESFGRTQVTVASAADVVERTDAAPAPTPLATAWPGTDAARERLEGMLLAPEGPFTVADNFSLNRFAQIGIARGTEPLYQPTDVAAPDSPEAAAVAGRNAAALVTLDDGATTDFLAGATAKAVPLPWLTDDPTIRVGEAVTFTHPVVLDFSFGLWRFQPTERLTAGDPSGVTPATFGDTRTAGPADVGGDLQVASMNVLNYFTDLGEELTGCTYFTDRAGDPVSVSGGCAARGAAEEEDFARQQSKIVHAINALGAEVVSLEEIENSAKFGHARDESLALLVEALNADLGAPDWAFVPTPADAPDAAGEDFIRTAFIYRPAAVQPVGASVIRPGGDTAGDPFGNARDPLAQVFQPVGAEQSDRFMLVVNHLKSKSSPPSAPDPNADYGQGGWNADRVAQARALASWVDTVKADRGVEKVYLDGDFNSYTYEDPMRELYGAGYTNLAVAKAAGPHHTYLFGGLVGSLDHGLANDAALADTTGATVWNINSVESVALEYSRHNYNATNFYDGATAYRSSDHDPLVFGIDTTPALPDTTLDVSVGPKNIRVDRTRALVDARLAREDGAPVDDGEVTVTLDGQVLGSVAVRDGAASLTLPPFRSVGEQVLTVRYAGGTSDPASREVIVSVRR